MISQKGLQKEEELDPCEPGVQVIQQAEGEGARVQGSLGNLVRACSKEIKHSVQVCPCVTHVKAE